MTIRDTLQGIVHRPTVRIWGQPATYTPQSTGVAESITAIYDAAAVSVQMQGEVPVQSVGPRLDVVLADLTVTPAQGDTVTVASLSWEVARVELDGHGAAKLALLRT